MKPTIPETGRVTQIDGDFATVLLHAGSSCKGCGAGEIGLCRASGSMSLLTVRNTLDAAIGDSVRVGLPRDIRKRGFLFAFVIPFIAFLAGSFIGYRIGSILTIPSFDVAAGFLSLIAASWYSFGKLKRLDRRHTMMMREVLSDTHSPGEVITEEERRFESYALRP